MTSLTGENRGRRSHHEAEQLLPWQIDFAMRESAQCRFGNPKYESEFKGRGYNRPQNRGNPTPSSGKSEDASSTRIYTKNPTPEGNANPQVHAIFAEKYQHPAVSGRHVLSGVRQSTPSSNIDSYAGDNITLPAVAEGKTNRPFSKRLENRHAPCLSHQKTLTSSPRRPRKTNRRPENGSRFRTS